MIAKACKANTRKSEAVELFGLKPHLSYIEGTRPARDSYQYPVSKYMQYKMWFSPPFGDL